MYSVYTQEQDLSKWRWQINGVIDYFPEKNPPVLFLLYIYNNNNNNNDLLTYIWNSNTLYFLIHKL